MVVITYFSQLIQNRRGWIITCATLMFVAACVLAMSGCFVPADSGVDEASEVDRLRVTYLVDCTVWIINILMWVFAVAWFKRNLEVPEGLWADVPAYVEALRRYRVRSGMLDARRGLPSLRSVREWWDLAWYEMDWDSHVKCVKMAFYGAWSIYLILTVVATFSLRLALPQLLFVIVLAAIVTTISAPTYFLCFSYVWLLKDLSRGDMPLSLPFLHRWPASTPEILRLTDVARYNALVFLVSSLLCSVGVLLHMRMLGPESGQLPFVAAVVVFLVGLASFGVLAVLARFYLGEIVRAWEIEAIRLHEDELGGRAAHGRLLPIRSENRVSTEGPSGEGYTDCRGYACEDVTHVVLRQGLSSQVIDLFSVALALVSLVVEVLALLVSLGIA